MEQKKAQNVVFLRSTLYESLPTRVAGRVRYDGGPHKIKTSPYPEYRVARVAQNNKHKSTQPWPLLRPPVGGPWRLQGMNTADRRMRPDAMGIEGGPGDGV